MTAETASSGQEQTETEAPGSGIARTHLITATTFLVIGSLLGALAALQLVVPALASTEFTTFGRLAPAAGLLLTDGWLTIGILGASYVALARLTGEGVKRSGVATAAMVIIAVGAVVGAVGILGGQQSGLVGQEAPFWSRPVSAIGYILAAFAIIGTARAGKDRLGATGWYLAAAPMWLAISGVVAALPTIDGVSGPIQVAFANAGFTGLFYLTASVGLLYFVFTSITNVDPTEPRPLAAMGFWSMTFVWANMAAVQLIYSPAPDWYETLGVAFAIASLIPLLTISGDIGLMLRGQVASITDRLSLRYGVIAGVALAGVTVVNLLLAWRATSAIVQFSTWVNGLDALVLLGVGSFAVFAASSVIRGGYRGSRTTHQVLSTVGLLLVSVGLLAGGVAVGFSWAAGPSSQMYANAGAAWKVTADTAQPFLWLAALGSLVFFSGQLAFLWMIGGPSDDELEAPDRQAAYDLEFEGPPRYATWGRLVWGVVGVWLFAAFMSWWIPMVDDGDEANTLLADISRTYPEGSAEAEGRAIYIAEGCVACHSQQVRPIGTDVGLGPVSLAGDYGNENPALLGSYRFGPDLMHFASSTEFFDKVLVQAHIEAPRSLAYWSTMPAYTHLSQAEIGALISYLETLE